MEAKIIVEEIKRLPIVKRFWVMEQILKSIRKDNLGELQNIEFEEENDLSISDIAVNEKSLAKDWLSKEDDQWDKYL